MNRFTILISLFVLCISCTEKGEDVGWKVRHQQQKTKTELLDELARLFKLAWENPEKAEEQLSYLYEKQSNNTPAMDKHAEVLANKEYVAQAISLARSWATMKLDMNNIDISNVHSTFSFVYNTTGLSYKLTPSSDPAILIQYRKQIHTQADSFFKSRVIKLPARNMEWEKSIQHSLGQYINDVHVKLKSYPQVSGKENFLENMDWHLIDYSITYQPPYPPEGPYKEKGINKNFTLKFKSNHKFECDSVLIPDFYHSFPYADIEGMDINLFKQNILLRSAPPLAANYRAGKEIKKEGEYYFGDKYLTLVFHLLDDYDMVICMEYDSNIFAEHANGKIIPVRDRPSHAMQTVGDTRTFLSVINSQKHFGTVQSYDALAMYGKGRYCAPFAWIKTINK